MTTHALVVDVQLACADSWMPPEEAIETWTRRAFDATCQNHSGPAEVSVRVVEAGEMQALNREYRQRDAPTNVLSFPAGEIEGLPKEATQNLGDIVICADIVNDEASVQDKAREAHWAHMLVHGMLHLLGYDHEDAAEAATMEELEKRVLARYGVADPYRESH